MADPVLLRHDANHIATLTLNAPHSLNALSVAMIASLHIEIKSLAGDSAIRVVVLRGAGKAFCAGHDLRELQAARTNADQGRGFCTALFDDCAAMMQALQSLPQPVIAQVQGIATAGGCQLAASSDLIVAADSARFGVNGINIGLFCSTPMVALTRKVPAAVAFEMLATGAFISAARAREVGLVNRTAPLETLDQATNELAQTLASKLPLALQMGKAAFYAQAALHLPDAYAYTGRVMVDNLALADTNEGIAAFLEKRLPNWPE